MISVKIAEFRNRLSTYLKKVRQGAEVVITDRDTPIGRLVPYEKGDEEEPFEMIPPKRGWGRLAKMKFTPVKMDYDIVEDLLADRKKDALLR